MRIRREKMPDGLRGCGRPQRRDQDAAKTALVIDDASIGVTEVAIVPSTSTATKVPTFTCNAQRHEGGEKNRDYRKCQQ